MKIGYKIFRVTKPCGSRYILSEEDAVNLVLADVVDKYPLSDINLVSVDIDDNGYAAVGVQIKTP